MHRFLPLLLCLIILQSACIPFSKLVRNNRKSPGSQSSLNTNPKKVIAEDFDPKSALDMSKQEIYRIFLAKDFDALEKIANQARAKKERLAGGYWKLDAVYEALTNIYAEYPGQEVTDEMWKNRIEVLENWKKDAPESITARVALAEAFVNYGWFARGRGTIDTVSSENRNLLNERLDLAENELSEARKLGVQCPRWYREALYIGMARGWSLEEYNEIYEEAIKSEPNYLQFYLLKSENLTPKWSGSQGDWQKFLDELPGKLATLETDEADIIYFTVLANKVNERSLTINYAIISKERIKKGFADLEKKYDVDNYRLNQFAFVASLIQELPAAKDAFKRIGNDWNKDVWSEQNFKLMSRLANEGTSIAQK